MLDRQTPPSGNAGATNDFYYDLVLALLPVPLLVGVVAGELLWIPSQTAVSVGALLSALALGHSLFRRPPTGGRPKKDSQTSGRRSGGPADRPSA